MKPRPGKVASPAIKTFSDPAQCYHSDPADYFASMRRLLDYPVRVVHGGHFPSYGAERHREIVGSWLMAKDVG